MDTQQRILVPIDFSDQSRQALAQADALAAESGDYLTLLHVHPIVEMAVLDFTYVQPAEKVAEICEMVDKRLKEWARELRTSAERVKTQVTTGGPVVEIVAMSEKFDMVVMSTHGRTGMSHFLMGSVTERVVQGAHCSVLIVKPKTRSKNK